MLGPIAIAWDGRPVDIGGVKARALIARLLIDRNLVVSVDRIVDSLWGEHDGRGPRSHCARPSRACASDYARPARPEDMILTRAPGYVLEVPAEVTDALRLERLVKEGRRHWPAGARARASGCSPRPRACGGARPTAR